MSASCVAVIMSESASAPLVRVIEACSSATRSTDATSPSGTTTPGCVVDASGMARSASSDSIGSPPCTGMSVPSPLTLPSGSVMPFASRASEMAVGEMPSCASAAWSGAMTMRCVSAPETVAARTPSIDSRRGTTTSSSCVVSSASESSSELAVRNMIGRADVEPPTTSGAASVGSVSSRPSSASFTDAVNSSASVP